MKIIYLAIVLSLAISTQLMVDASEDDEKIDEQSSMSVQNDQKPKRPASQSNKEEEDSCKKVSKVLKTNPKIKLSFFKKVLIGVLNSQIRLVVNFADKFMTPSTFLTKNLFKLEKELIHLSSKVYRYISKLHSYSIDLDSIESGFKDKVHRVINDLNKMHVKIKELKQQKNDDKKKDKKQDPLERSAPDPRLSLKLESKFPNLISVVEAIQFKNLNESTKSQLSSCQREIVNVTQLNPKPIELMLEEYSNLTKQQEQQETKNDTSTQKSLLKFGPNFLQEPKKHFWDEEDEPQSLLCQDCRSEKLSFGLSLKKLLKSKFVSQNIYHIVHLLVVAILICSVVCYCLITNGCCRSWFSCCCCRSSTPPNSHQQQMPHQCSCRKETFYQNDDFLPQPPHPLPQQSTPPSSVHQESSLKSVSSIASVEMNQTTS